MALPISSNASRTPNSPLPLIYSKPPLAHRFIYFLKVWGLKILSAFGFLLLRYFKPLPRESQPTIIKAYPCRPHLRNRIFVPRSHKTGELLPLYLNVHGGGFTFCDAEFDDEFCSRLANQFNILVVNIEYGTAPLNRFPIPRDDVTAISLAAIEDESLPIDKKRVVLGGFSAGGNLCMSVAQQKALREMIKGLVVWYPVTDISLKPADKQSTRPYRNAKDVDDLKDWGPIWNWSYIPPGVDILDPKISVRYAKKKDLPKWIFMIGAEYDMLMKEARDTIYDIAELSEQERKLGLNGFQKGSYKWTLVKDVRHAFTHDLMDNRGKEIEETRQMQYAKTLEQVGKWLFDGPFAV